MSTINPTRDLIVFAVTFAASAAAPGPEVAAFLGRSVSRGVRGGAPLALGIVCGKLLLLAGAVAGLAALVPLLGPAFDVLAYCGAAYLVWLGIKKWRYTGRGAPECYPPAAPRVLPEFGLGLFMTMSNPIALAFYLALLPGILQVDQIGLREYLVLSLVLCSVMALVLLTYGLVGQAIRQCFSGSIAAMRVERISGAVFVAAGLWLVVRTL